MLIVIMVTGLGNGPFHPSSHSFNILGKVMNPTILFPAVSKLWVRLYFFK